MQFETHYCLLLVSFDITRGRQWIITAGVVVLILSYLSDDFVFHKTAQTTWLHKDQEKHPRCNVAIMLVKMLLNQNDK